MKDKLKKILIPIIVVIVVLIIIGCVLFKFVLTDKAKNEDKNNIDNNEVNTVDTNYTAYISINPLIKLTFKVSCKDNVCSEPLVTDYELVNDDAKEIYNDINIKGKTLNDSVNELASIAENNNYSFETIKVYTDWSNDDYFENNNDISIDVEIKSTEEIKETIDEELNDNTEKNMINKLIDYMPIEMINLSDGLRYFAIELGENVYYSCTPGTTGCIMPTPVTEITINGEKDIVEKVGPCEVSIKEDKYDYYVQAYVDLKDLGVGTHKVKVNYKSSSSKVEIIPHEEESWVIIKIDAID